MGKILVGVNARGWRVGETHHRAKLTERDIDLIFYLHKEKMKPSMIAEKFGVSKSTIHNILTFKQRAQQPTFWRRVHLKAKRALE